MDNLIKEINHNYTHFRTNWKTTLDQKFNELGSNQNKYKLSYLRLTSLQAWKAEILEKKLSPGVLEFFTEAQNDALLSHIFANTGTWRVSLRSLRCCIDNLLFCLYYKDHPIEYRLWLSGKHTPQFSDLFNYLKKHPDLSGVPNSISGIVTLENEYKILSKAVHASTKSFRMTDNDYPQLFVNSNQKRSAWNTRERITLLSINLIFLSMFKEELQGSKLLSLRKSISLVVPNSKYQQIKRVHKINLINA